eukprot:Gb_15440 [translate_table: standard]
MLGCCRFEGKLVKIVVLDILEIMQKVDYLDVAKCPVALKERMDKVIELLEMGSDANVVTVGIHSMGGVGKTTLAKAVYNNLRLSFGTACFVSDVRHRAAAEKNGLPELQRQILRDLIKYDVKVNDVFQGKNLMRKRLSSLIVLVILDDVDNLDQLDALLGDWFRAGSKIIVTTRDKHVLNVGRIDRLYEPSELERDEALRLFSWHAYLRAYPSSNLYNLSEEIVKACRGLPLSLEVMGAYLYDKQHEELLSHEALTKLGRAMYEGIQGKLRISYEGLNWEEREMFLDIADYTGITDLPTSLGNLSCLERMSVSHCSALGAVPASVGKLKQLKFLNAEACENLTCLGEEFGQLTQLEELNLSGCKKLGELPNRFGNLRKLRVLRIRSTGLTKVPPSFSALKSLIVMDAGEVPLSEGGLPSDIGKLASLEVLRLEFTELCTLPAEFTHLSRLTKLYLHNCPFLSELSCLPAELVEVDIGNCRNLRKISGMLNLKELEILWLNNCEQLTHLPGLRSLHALAELNISGCESLRNEAPEGLETLKSLQKLHFSGCGVLKVDFLKCIKGMPLLRELSFYASEIPEWFDYRMKTKVVGEEYANHLCMDVCFLPENESSKCVGIIFCFILHDQGWGTWEDVPGRYGTSGFTPTKATIIRGDQEILSDNACGFTYMKATIVRGGQEVFETVFFRSRQVDSRDQLCLSMYLENDSFVKRLHSGDRIRISAMQIIEFGG